MSLRDQLIARITATGPMTIADYMTECLLHPEFGYYITRDPLGAGGDFTTAPEISQMFGELIGLSLAQAWIDQGSPAPFALAELGPGRGTLMADILRATKGLAGFHAAAEVHLVEASPVLRSVQAKAVPRATFHDHIADLPQLPLFLVANEFFDALPIRQFIRAEGGWSEKVVGVTDGALAFGLTQAAPLEMLEDRLDATPISQIVEHCAALPALVDDIARLIDVNGGTALIIDYGSDGIDGDTFQAVQAHEKVEALTNPGGADLTAHVDFAAIRGAAGCVATQVTPQGVFLERLGITQRAQTLAQGLSKDALGNHIAAHRRLTHPDEMGKLFNVIGLIPRDAPPPPGLEL